VLEAIDTLRSRHSGQIPLTNYFRQPLDRVDSLRLLVGDRTVCFLHDEWDFSRLYVVSYAAADLESLLVAISWPALVAADWISRTGCTEIGTPLSAAGFHLHATYDRILCRNLRRDMPNSHLRFADACESERVHALLFRAFDKYADHIPRQSEVRDLIRLQQVLITRGDWGDDINGLVVFPIQGRTCNFNFLYNEGLPRQLAHLLGNFYGVLAQRGVESGFSWVRRTRPAVLRLHQSFGWTPDGLVDYIFLRS
jgi:hypothetical protein